MMRWTAKLKAEIVESVRAGALLPPDVSPEEFAEWRDSLDAHGLEALKSTKLQRFRVANRRPRVCRVRP
jgi:hypothetical protein